MPRVLKIYKSIEMIACENPGVPPRSVEDLLKVIRDKYVREEWNKKKEF